MKAAGLVCVLVLSFVYVSARQTQLLRESNKCAQFKSCDTCLGKRKEVLKLQWGLLPSLKKVKYDCLWLPYYLGSKDGECLSSRRYEKNKLGSSSKADGAGSVLGQSVEDVCPTSSHCKQIGDPLICLASGCHLASAMPLRGTAVAMCLSKAEATAGGSPMKDFADNADKDIVATAKWFSQIITANVETHIKRFKSIVEYLQFRLLSPIVNNLADVELFVLGAHEANFAKAVARETGAKSCDTSELQDMFRDLVSIIDAIPSSASFRDPFFLKVLNMFPAARIEKCKEAIDFDNMETTAPEEDVAFRARALQEREGDITRSRKDMLKRSLETWARYGIPDPVFWLPPVKQTELTQWGQNPKTKAQPPRAGALFDDIKLTKQVVKNVLNMIETFNVQHEVLTAIKSRYEGYKLVLKSGTRVDLPKYYHATKYADLIIKSQKLKTSDIGRYGPGIYLSTVPEMDGVKKKKAEYGDFGFALGASFEKYFVTGAFMRVVAGYDPHLWVIAQPADQLHPFIERKELVYAFAAKESAIQKLKMWFEEQAIEALVITYEEAMIERELLNQARIESRDRANALLESRFSIAEAVQKSVYRSNIKVSGEVCYEDAIPLLVKSIDEEHIKASMQWYFLRSNAEDLKLNPTVVEYMFYKNPAQKDQTGTWDDVHYSQYVGGKYFSQAETKGLECTGLTVANDDVLTSLANGDFAVVSAGVCDVDTASPVADLLQAMQTYRTTNTQFHDGDLLHHSVWSAKAASRLLGLPASHPEAYFSQLIREMEEMETLDRVKLLTILSSLLHDVGKGGWGERTKKLGKTPASDSSRVFDLIELHPEISFCMLASSDIEDAPKVEESAEESGGADSKVPQAMKWVDGGESKAIFADFITNTLKLSEDEQKLVAVLAGMHYEFGNFLSRLQHTEERWFSAKVGVQGIDPIYGSLPLPLLHTRFGANFVKVEEAAEQYVMMFRYLAKLVNLDLCNVEITTTSETTPKVQLSLEQLVEMAVLVGVADVLGSNLVDIPDTAGELMLPAVCNEVPHAATNKLWKTYSYGPEEAGQGPSLLLEYVHGKLSEEPSYCDSKAAGAPPKLSNNVTPNPCAEKDSLFEFCGCVESHAK